MKFDQPAGTNPIDQLKVVGKSHAIDGSVIHFIANGTLCLGHGPVSSYDDDVRD